MEKEVCTCDLFAKMLPPLCIWECPKHGKTGVVRTFSVIKEIARIEEIDFDEAWELADVALKGLQEEHDRQKLVYNQMRNFNDDIKEHFGLTVRKVRVVRRGTESGVVIEILSKSNECALKEAKSRIMERALLNHKIQIYDEED